MTTWGIPFLKSVKAGLHSDFVRLCITEDGGEYSATIAEIPLGGHGVNREQAIKNAEQIANLQNVREALSQLLDRLDYHGNIDPIREEGPIQDARDALAGEIK